MRCVNLQGTVHQIKAFIPVGRCRKKDRVSFTYGD